MRAALDCISRCPFVVVEAIQQPGVYRCACETRVLSCEPGRTMMRDQGTTELPSRRKSTSLIREIRIEFSSQDIAKRVASPAIVLEAVLSLRQSATTAPVFLYC